LQREEREEFLKTLRELKFSSNYVGAFEVENSRWKVART